MIVVFDSSKKIICDKHYKGIKFMINKHESYVIITYFLELDEVAHNAFVCSSTSTNYQWQ